MDTCTNCLNKTCPLKERVRQLERELDSLRSYLDEKDTSLVKAAEVGQALLRQNAALEDRLTEITKENTQKIEELEQERFTLQQKLDCQKAALLTVQQDTDSLRNEVRQEFEMKEEHLKQEHSKKMCEAELLMSDLRGEIERLETQLKTGRDKITTLEERVREMAEQIETAPSNSYLQPELRELEQIYRQEHIEKEGLQGQLSDVIEERDLLGMEVEELTRKVEKLTEECQERSDQANEWYKALQTSKEEVMELNAELDKLKLDMGNSHSTAGNSLFGEVDDRRLQVERKYVSLQVKHDSLEKRHESMSQQYKRLKGEMSSLLCQFSVVGADAAHIRRLEMALKQAQSEKESLLTKLHKLEKQQVRILASQERLQYVASFGDKKEYIALIEQQLNKARKENSGVTKELEVKGLQLVWETQKLRETEAKLRHKEQEMARGKKEVSIMKLKLHELQEKMDKADSYCKQQEAQVHLLEKELQQQRYSGPRQKGGHTSQRDSRHNTTTTTCDTTVLEPSHESGDYGREVETSDKENRQLSAGVQKMRGKAVKTEPAAPINFLEEIELEFEKQKKSSQAAQLVRGRQQQQQLIKPHNKDTMQSMRKAQSAVTTTTTTRTMPYYDSKTKVNQCPQQ